MWAVAWGIAAVLLCVLWVRSFWVWDTITYLTDPAAAAVNGPLQIECESWRGVCSLYVEPASEWETTSFFYRWDHSTKAPPVWLPQKSWNYGHDPVRESYEIKVPHWFLLVFVATAAAVPRMPSPKRFSLRTLLIATTILAVLLGE